VQGPILVKGSTDILIHSTIGKVIATSALKAPEGFTKIAPSAVVILGYGAAFSFLSFILNGSIQIRIVYVAWSRADIPPALILYNLFYKQTLGLLAVFLHPIDNVWRHNNQPTLKKLDTLKSKVLWGLQGSNRI
jgi:multidrug transporter EmrE-like cation transporter